MPALQGNQFHELEAPVPLPKLEPPDVQKEALTPPEKMAVRAKLRPMPPFGERRTIDRLFSLKCSLSD
jgi:hypothetical protein